MLRCQFLCYVLKTLFFIKIALKLSYFCKKMQKFRSIGLWRLEASPPDPKISPPTPHCEFLATRLVPFLVKTFFLVFTWIRRKKEFHFSWRPFFALHLIYSPEKNRGRGSSPPMLKIGQNWGKIANYPPQCSTKICTPAYLDLEIRLDCKT